MLKKLCLISAALLAALCAALPGGAARADDRAVVEYDPAGIVLPLLRTEEGQAYRVEVFAESDAAYARPLAVEQGTVLFPEALGGYRLRYTVNDNGVEHTVYRTLEVADTTVPEFSLSLRGEYAAGEEISLRPEIRDNTARWATVRYEMMRDGRMISPEIEGGVFRPELPGTYKVKVTVTDAGGNSARRTLSFSVGGSTRPGKKSRTGLIVVLSCGGAALLLGGGAAIFLIMRKKAGGKSNDDE